MNKSIQCVMFGLSISLLLPALADDESVVDVAENDAVEEIIDDAASDVIEMGKRKPRHRRNREIRNAVVEYQLENGDITQEQLDARQAEREQVKAELKELRDNGDTEALKERRAELKEARQQRREEMKEYVAEHDELAEQVQELRDAAKERRRERRRERRQERAEG